MDTFKYMLITRKDMVICIKYTDNAAMTLFEHLYDRGWKMEASNQETYESKSVNGGVIQTMIVDANTKKIDI